MNEHSEPVLTVVCVAYNQEKYIAQALDSFLAQETDFPFQIYVGDDCSQDDTPLIIDSYASRYPNKVFLFSRTDNIGAERNNIDLCERARTKYIALCDGDDYWVDKLKLQKQYNLMESHTELRGCFHDTEIVLENPGERWFLSNDYGNTSDGKLRWSTGHNQFVKKDCYTIKDYIPCGFVHTSSMFFRWDYGIEIPEWFYHHILGDYTLWVIQIGLGCFGYIDEVMSVYRKHDRGSYHFNSRLDFWEQTKEDWISIDEDVKGYLESIGAEGNVIEVVNRRQRDDLVKLLRAKSRKWSNLKDFFKANAPIMNCHTSVPVPDRMSGFAMRKYSRKVDKELKFRARHSYGRRIKRKIYRIMNID